MFVLTRNVTVSECPWLDNDIEEGTIVHRYKGYTYGCISDNGIAVTLKPDTLPCMELPIDSLKVIK